MTFYKKLQVFLILFSLLPFLYCTYINRTAHYAVWPIKTVWHEITYFDTAYVHESKDKDVVHTYASAAEAYEKGVEYLEEDSVDYAIEAFKQAVKINKKYIEAHHQMGLAYLEKNTIYYRRKAVKSLREALFWERDNFKVQLDLGKAYLMQRFRYNARKKFTWLKKTNPDNIELLLSLGRLYREDVEYYQNMVDVFTDDSGVLSFVDQDLLSAIFTYDGPRQVKEFLRDRDEFDSKFQDFSSYLKKDFANAAVAFTQVLGIDPKNREALYELSLLAFTAGMFGEFVKYQEKILELDPNDKDVHLFLGLGYHRIKDYESAFKEYNIARSLMEKDELSVFDSIDFIIPSERRKQYERAGIDGKAEFEEKFWKKRDPLFLTKYNERILEHYSRIAFSNLKFTPKKMKNPRPGWKTDRGKIYIRYGQPLRIARLRPSHSAAGGSGFELTEIWYYNNFSFVFSDEYMTGNFILGSRNRMRGVNFKELADVHYKENSEIYQHRYEGSYFDVPYFTADFRGKKNNTQTDIYYGVPKNSLMCTHIDTSRVASIVKGFFIFDHDWNELQRSVIREKLFFNPLLNPDIDFHVIGQDNLEVLPGSYNFAFEVLDERSGNTYAQRSTLEVDSYKAGSLKVSDIVLASLIDSTFEKSQFSSHELADDLKIIPNPARCYKKAQPVYLYFEVYNLMVTTPGGTSFDVTYNIKSADRKKSAASKLFSAIGKPFGAGEDKVRISSSYVYQGHLPVEKVYLSIDMSALKNDVYDLAVIVKDINTGTVVSKETQLMVQDDTIYYLY